MMLEEILKDMENYGRPSIVKFEKGWYCVIEVFITGEGIQFKIASEMNNQTPLAAAQQCEERLIAAMRGVVEKMKRLSE